MDIQKIIEETCKTCGTTELSEKIFWQFKPIACRLGQATYYFKLKSGLLDFNSLLWERADEQTKYETVIHEVCHIIAPYRFGRIKPHGIEWQFMMRLNKLEPKRCHSVDVSDIRKKRRQQATCFCGPREISTIVFNKIKKGYSYRCRKCNGPIVL